MLQMLFLGIAKR